MQMNEKKGAFRCLFFALPPILTRVLALAITCVLASLLYSPVILAEFSHVSANLCPAQHIDQQAKVKYVHDGDTIVLKNGEKIRLIGINTAELARKQKNTVIKAEPCANAARDYLKQLLPQNTTIRLQLGQDKKDHYGRTLAHVFLSSGENVQANLLKQGLASAIIIPPNDSLANCYRKVEQLARCQKLALWSQSSHILNSQQVTSSAKGFHLVQGKVTHIERNRYGIWIQLAGGLTLGIRPQNQPLFDMKHITSLTGKVLLARGWLNKGKNNQPYMRIRHPLSLEVVSKNICLSN